MGCGVSCCKAGKRPGSSSSSFYCVGIPNDSDPRLHASCPVQVKMGRTWANSHQSGDRETRLAQQTQGGASINSLQPESSSQTMRAVCSPLRAPRPRVHQRSTSSSSPSTSATSSLSMASKAPSSQDTLAPPRIPWNQLWV